MEELRKIRKRFFIYNALDKILSNSDYTALNDWKVVHKELERI
jgi:hypothetical protein